MTGAKSGTNFATPLAAAIIPPANPLAPPPLVKALAIPPLIMDVAACLCPPLPENNSVNPTPPGPEIIELNSFNAINVDAALLAAIPILDKDLTVSPPSSANSCKNPLAILIPDCK